MVFIPSQSVLAPGSGSWAFVFSDFNKGSFEVLRRPFSLSESSKSFSILQEKKRGGGYINHAIGRMNVNLVSQSFPINI